MVRYKLIKASFKLVVVINNNSCFNYSSLIKEEDSRVITVSYLNWLWLLIIIITVSKVRARRTLKVILILIIVLLNLYDYY